LQCGRYCKATGTGSSFTGQMAEKDCDFENAFVNADISPSVTIISAIMQLVDMRQLMTTQQ